MRYYDRPLAPGTRLVSNHWLQLGQSMEVAHTSMASGEVRVRQILTDDEMLLGLAPDEGFISSLHITGILPPEGLSSGEALSWLDQEVTVTRARTGAGNNDEQLLERHDRRREAGQGALPRFNDETGEPLRAGFTARFDSGDEWARSATKWKRGPHVAGVNRRWHSWEEMLFLYPGAKPLLTAPLGVFWEGYLRNPEAAVEDQVFTSWLTTPQRESLV